MSAQKIFLSIAAVCIVGIAASVLWRHRTVAVQLAAGTYLTPARELPDFSLIDQRGQTFGTAQLRGHWSLLYFGYTNCPDVCPATLTALAAMQKRLRAAKAAVLPQVIFVSVDTKRDTPGQIARYVPNVDPEFIGLSAADQPGIEAVARKLGVAVMIRPPSGSNYTVDHTGAILVLNPDGRLAAILTGPFSVPALQGDFQRIVAARGIESGRT